MRIAIITGATSGMGREMTRQIDKTVSAVEGFWLIGRRKTELSLTASMLTKSSKLFALDLSKIKDLEALNEALRDEKPEVLFLVNAAGLGKIGAFQRIPWKDLMEIDDVNVRALTVVTSLCLPYMRRGGKKASYLINFSSGSAFLPQPYFASYAASKSYVLNLSRALRKELHGSGITVTAVCPGPVRTEFFKTAESTGRMAPYKKYFMADAKKVCQKALQDSLKGRALSVYGITMKLLHVFSHIVPAELILRFYHVEKEEDRSCGN